MISKPLVAFNPETPLLGISVQLTSNSRPSSNFDHGFEERTRY